MKVLTYERPYYEMAATENFYIYQFKSLPFLNPVTFVLGDGSPIRPGDRFTKIGGKHKSACFRIIHLVSGYLEYVGTFDEPGNLQTMMFSYSEVPAPHILYGGPIISLNPLTLCFSTPAVSSRLVETTVIERTDR